MNNLYYDCTLISNYWYTLVVLYFLVLWMGIEARLFSDFKLINSWNFSYFENVIFFISKVILWVGANLFSVLSFGNCRLYSLVISGQCAQSYLNNNPPYQWPPHPSRVNQEVLKSWFNYTISRIYSSRMSSAICSWDFIRIFSMIIFGSVWAGAWISLDDCFSFVDLSCSRFD